MNDEKMVKEEVKAADTEAVRDKRPKTRKRLVWRAVTCAVLAILVLGAALLIPKLDLKGLHKPFMEGSNDATEAPADPDVTAAPEATAIPDTEGYLVTAPEEREYAKSPYSKELDWGSAEFESMEREWTRQLSARREAAVNAPDINAFSSALIKALREEAGEGNLVCSPLNIYMALAMLTETTGGDTRAELLDALGAKSIEELRASAAAYLAAEPNDDGVSKCTIANSLWMCSRIGYMTDALETLAECYGASSYWGDPAEEAYSQALRDWLNENTGGLLKDSVNNVKMDPETVLALASTVYLKAAWSSDYREEETAPRTFRGKKGDKETDFMNKRDTTTLYYKGEDYALFCDCLKNGGRMWYILPDEGVDPAELMERIGFSFTDGSLFGSTRCTVVVSAPKLDVTSELSLIPALKAMGINRCFDPSLSDFTPLTRDTDGLCVTSAKHAARVKTDEEGIEAAAYTVMLVNETAAMIDPETVYFTLDRPFAFVVTGMTDAPMFFGIVNDID